MAEGVNDNSWLRAIEGGGLPANDPSRDTLAGRVSGPQVCGWRQLISSAVSTVNGANIPYTATATGGGLNSGTALFYILYQLPEVLWWTNPNLVGFYYFDFANPKRP